MSQHVSIQGVGRPTKHQLQPLFWSFFKTISLQPGKGSGCFDAATSDCQKSVSTRPVSVPIPVRRSIHPLGYVSTDASQCLDGSLAMAAAQNQPASPLNQPRN